MFLQKQHCAVRAVLMASLLVFACGIIDARAQSPLHGPSSPERPVPSLPSLQSLPSPNEQRSHWKAGAIVGFVAGAGVTYLVLHSGGSTSPCDRSANQDAMSSGECIGLTAAGGLVGAGIGALIGSRIRSERRGDVTPELRVVPRRAGGTAIGLRLWW